MEKYKLIKQRTFAGKNTVYLNDKYEKVKAEINVIMNGEIGQTNLMAVGFRNKKNAYALKKYQLEILDIISASEVCDLVGIMERKSHLMCKNCQEGLEIGDLKCRKDLKNFIFADMIRRSLL